MQQDRLLNFILSTLRSWINPFLQNISWSSWFKLPSTLTPEEASVINLLLILLAAGLGGTIVFACCRYYYRGVPISRQMDTSLIPASVLAALIFYQSSSWPALSILLVAVLGFVHYRTVIKDMTDVLFVFWSILSGIFFGIGFPLPTLALDAAIAIGMGIYVNRRSSQLVYLLIIRYDPHIAKQLMETLQLLHGKVRSQFERNGLIDMTVEVRLRYISMAIVDSIAAMEGVHNAIMVSNDGNPGF